MTSRYLVLRFFRLIITLYIVVSLTFFILRLAPGSPISQYISPTFTEKQLETLIHQFGLDQPLHVQYVRYLASISTLKFGRSIRYRQDVIDLIAAKIPNTLFLLLPTLLVTYVVGVLWGMLVGWRRGSTFEHISLLIVLTGRAAPNFWVGMMAISLFAFRLGWFPSSGMSEPGAYFDSVWARVFSWDFIRHLVLPMGTFAFYLVGLPLLVMRTGMLEMVNRDFIMMHRYCGLNETRVMLRAARNALLPVVTVIALGIGYIFEGAPVIETVFGWPGIGLLLVNAVTSRDYPLAQGCFLLLAACVLVMNFLADVVYCILDPRISTGRRLR